MSKSKVKTLLVLERSEVELQVQKSGKDYILEGVFTEFGVRNKNGRIYEAAEVAPHIQELQKKITERNLLGELDHPKSFEILMKNASHVIEELRFDEEKQQVIGRIRLLNTTNGREAKAFVDDNVPLHISSRSAGVVESSGKVKIKKMFTYDLVADPGFANAQLERVNEAYGFDPNGPVSLFEIDESIPGLDDTPNNSKSPMTEGQEYISRDDFNKYTELVKSSTEKAFNKVREEFKAALNEAKAGQAQGLPGAPADSDELKGLNEKYEALEKRVQNLIKHNNYIVENLEKVASYSDLIAKGVNENLSEVATKEVADKLISYVDMLGEKLDSTMEYTKHVVNEVNSRFRYQTMVNEHTDALITHNDYIVESVDSVIRYSEHLREHLESLGESVDLVAESIKTGSAVVVETAAPAPAVAAPAVKAEVKEVSEAVDDIDAKLNDILNESEPAQEQKPSYTKEPFYNFLNRERRAELDAMSDEKQTRVVEAFKANKYYGSVDVGRIWEHAVSDRPKSLNWLSDAPEKYRGVWESLKPERRNAIKAQASMRTLDTEYKIQDFWDTRDLRAVAPELVAESRMAVPKGGVDEDPTYRTDSAWMSEVQKGLKERFQR